MPIQVNILHVDKNLEIDPNFIKIQDLKNRYGLVDLERIYIDRDKPSNKLRASIMSVAQFINVIKYGVYLDITSKKHQVTASIMHARVCNKCGSLSHKEKECNFALPRCLRCGVSSHETNQCKKEKPECINCGSNHQTNSDQCEKLADKTYQMNKFIIDILVGEGIIKDKKAILRTNNFESRCFPNVSDEKNLEKILESML